MIEVKPDGFKVLSFIQKDGGKHTTQEWAAKLADAGIVKTDGTEMTYRSVQAYLYLTKGMKDYLDIEESAEMVNGKAKAVKKISVPADVELVEVAYKEKVVKKED